MVIGGTGGFVLVAERATHEMESLHASLTRQ